MVNWTCTYCAHVNIEFHQYRCSHCNNVNNGLYHLESNANLYRENTNNISISYANASARQWNCEYCTFLNESSSTHCEMCQNPINQFVSTNVSHKVSKITRIKSIDDTVVPDDLSRDQMKAKKIRNSIVSSVGDQKFTDHEFPAITRSIGSSQNEQYITQNLSSSLHQSLSAHITWLRPESLRGDEYSFSQLPWAVTRNPSSDDIVQGKLGNCWLLTGLALIADRPNMLDRILITKQIDPTGLYQIRLCKDGMWTVVTIDDLFPASQFDQMIFSRANRKQLWVSLIEKAAAKLYGSYESLTLGYCADGLSLLTGCPCETLKLSGLTGESRSSLRKQSFSSVESISVGEDNEEKNTADTVWAMLLSAKDANFITCVSCSSQDDNPEFLNELHKLGLRNLHAYAILDVKDIPSVNLRLLRLKNPWACMTWKGKWSDNDESWDTLPNDIRNEIQPPGVSGEACGVFWISWSDVLTYFFALDICRCQTNWYETRMETHLPWPVWIDLNTQELRTNIDLATQAAIPETNNFIRASSPILEIEENNTCAVLTVLESTQFQIGLWQSNCRIRKNKPIDILIVICSDYKSPIGPIVACSKRQTSSYVTCDAFLDKGTYTIFYISLYYWQCSWNLDSHSRLNMPNVDFYDSELCSSLFECTLSVHSSRPILLNRAVLTPEMIPRVISELALLKGDLQLFGQVQVFTLMKGYAGMIMLVLNPLKNTEIRCTSDCSGSINLINSRGKNVTKSEDVLLPGYCQIITVLTQDDAFSSYSLQHKYTASNSPLKLIIEYPHLFGVPDKNHWPPIQLILHQPMRLC